MNTKLWSLKYTPNTATAVEEKAIRIRSVSYTHLLGVPVRSIRYCGCDHGFLDMLGTIVQSEELCLTIAAELKAL